MQESDNVARDSQSALPRDTSRFKHLHPNGRAVIRTDAQKALEFISTAELLSTNAQTAG
ncbi:hypothetical protein [Phreatobacter sp.]|uniref:hypothetical protein n=1 Tax=Phreatobacter sp. TaxID=1966341 RepID=UPI003F6F4ED3